VSEGDQTSLPDHIRNIGDLREHLQLAIEIEHTTIPPYLCALYSIKPGQNQRAAEIIRTVLVQEMLHMLLDANVLNAIGGAPVIDHPDFVPAFPAQLPFGKDTPLTVNLGKFSPEAIDTFLAIEHPAPQSPKAMALAFPAPVPVPPGQLREAVRSGRLYPSIGDFYSAIERAMKALEAAAQQKGETIFVGDPARQITREYYYDARGSAFPVVDLASALAALSEIVEEGEGFREAPGALVHDSEGELGHYYRFNEIKLGRLYQFGDTVESGPTGPALPVVYGPDAVYDMIDNPRVEACAPGETRAGMETFNQTYTGLLRALHRGCNGELTQFVKGVVEMFALKDQAIGLMRNPFPGAGKAAGPSFEYAGTTLP